MNQDLTEFIQKKQKSAGAGAPIDWDERRNNYLQAVEGLYLRINELLGESIAQSTVSLKRRAKQLTEDYIGTYSVDDLILLIGDEQVRFSPRGRNMVGTAGRVDIVGERGEAMLVLQSNAQWAFVRTRVPTLQVAPLDESALTEVLKLVMRD